MCGIPSGMKTLVSLRTAQKTEEFELLASRHGWQKRLMVKRAMVDEEEPI